MMFKIVLFKNLFFFLCTSSFICGLIFAISQIFWLVAKINPREIFEKWLFAKIKLGGGGGGGGGGTYWREAPIKLFLFQGMVEGGGGGLKRGWALIIGFTVYVFYPEFLKDHNTNFQPDFYLIFCSFHNNAS